MNKIYHKILAILAIFLSFFLTIKNNLDPDLGWHLRSGQWILSHHTIQHFDEFSFTMSGHRWVNHEWLVDIILYFLNQNHLQWLTIGFFTLLATIPIGYYLFRSKNKLDFFLILIMSFSLTNYLGIRPQIISWFFFFLLSIFLNHLSSPKNLTIKHILLLILLFWLWANLHAGFPIGLLLYFLFIFSHFFDRRHPFPWLSHLITFTLCLLITLINPYHFELWQEIIAVGTSVLTSQYITEWQSILVFFNPESWFILATCLLVIFKFRRYLQPYHFITSLIFAFAYLKSARLGPFFFLLFFPIILSVTPKIIQLVQQSLAKHPPLRLQLFFVTNLILIITFTNIIGKIIFLKPIPTPQTAISFLQQHYQPTDITIFNSYSYGGYLINNYPTIKVFIDGRMPHWTDPANNSAMSDYIQVITQSNAWPAIFAKYQINTVLLSKNSFSQPASPFTKTIINYINQNQFLAYLTQKYIQPPSVDLVSELTSQQWQVVYEDSQNIILRPENQLFPTY